jgi:beta-lactamase regulating signal transducer with metallopeptidase domain
MERDAMTAVLQHPYVQALAWALVHFLWQGAALAAAAYLVVRVTRCGAEARYTIGVVTLGLMLAMPVVTTAWLAPRVSGPVEPAAARLVPRVTSGTARASGPAVSTRAISIVGVAQLVTPAPARPASASALPFVVLALWLTGVAVFSLRLAGGWVVARRLVWRSVRPASAEIQALARRVAGRLALDRIVRVVESSAVAVPVMIGWVKPVVLLPASALSGLTPVQLEALLAHELAHIRRHDYLVNLLQSVVETLLFYHPAVWWVSHQVRTEREHCCDDLAVGVCDRLVYVTALADLAAMAAGPNIALAATDGSLLARVRRILGQPRDDRAPGFGWLLGVMGALIAVVIIPVGLASARVADHGPGAGAAGTPQVVVTGKRGAAVGGTSAVVVNGTAGGAGGTVVAGVQGGIGGGVQGGVGGGVAGGIGGGVAGGIDGGVAGGVSGGVGEGIGLGVPQGMPLTAEEQARIRAELAQLQAERQADLRQKMAGMQAEQQAMARALDELAAAKAARSDNDTLAALEDQVALAKRKMDATNAALVAQQQQRLDVMRSGIQQDLAQRQVEQMQALNRAMAENQAKLAAEQQAVAASQAAAKARTATAVSEDTQGTSGNSTWSTNGDNVSVKWTGAFRLSDDDKDITWVEAGKTVDVSHGSWLDSTRVEIKGLANGGVEHTYYRNDIARPYEPEGRVFLAEMLQKIIRQSGFGAQSRVARFLKQGGVNAVLAEIEKLQGDYARRVYYGELFKQAKLSPAEITQIATRASQTIGSDYELSTLLRTAAKQAGTDESALVAVIRATSTIKSDYEMHRSLSASLPAHPTAKEAAAALASAAGLQSDYERASFLIEFAKKGGLSSSTEAAFFDLVHGIHGSYDQGRVLKAVMAMPEVSESSRAEARKASQSMSSDYDRRQVLSASMAGDTLSARDAGQVLASASAIRSENDRSTLLIELVKKGGLTDETAPAFFPLVAGMHSSYEQRQVISAVLARPAVSEGVLTNLLKAAASVNGDFDRAEVLIAVAKRQKLTAAQRALYLSAADGIRSDYDQTRALAELVRAERTAR